MMAVTAGFRDLLHGGKTYPRGRVTLDGNVAKLEAEVPRRIRIGRPKTFTVLEPITPTTTISCKPPTLTIGGSTFTVPDPEALSSLMLAASLPRVEDRQRRRERVAQAAEAARLFLVERAVALEQARRLEADSRLSLADFSGEEDPVQSFIESASRGFRERYRDANAKISGLTGDIGEAGVRRVFAAVYAAGRAQDAVFSGDGELIVNAVALAERATGRTLRLEAMRSMQIPELTEALCAAISGAALELFDAAEEALTVHHRLNECR